ncbi:MAG: CDP-alcohol phosphatidyltransferase family protein [Syntrophales bacterium]
MSTSLPTLQEIREAHSWKRNYERFLPVSRFIFRPLGFLATWLALRLGITSEAVSWLSSVVGLTGCIFLISVKGKFLVAGIGVLLLFNLLDCVDGSIARTMKTENPYGRFLDSICGSIIDLIFWAVVGVMAFRNPEYLLIQKIVPVPVFTWLIIGSLTCFLFIWLGYLEQTFDSLLRPAWETLGVSENTSPPHLNIQQDTPDTAYGIANVVHIINHNLRVRETHYMILLIAFIGRSIDLFLVIFFVYYLLSNILLTVIYSLRGAKVKKSFAKKTDR